MTTRSKTKPVTKAVAPAPVALKTYYAGQILENLYCLGKYASVEGAVRSDTFRVFAEDECWEGEILYFLEVDDKDNITTHKYRVRQAGYVIEKP